MSRDTQARQLYQGLLYSGLLIVFLDSWRRQAPQRPAWGRLRDFPLYAVFGLASALVLRVVLVALGARVWPDLVLTPQVILVALLYALAVAVVEEAVFRGFLLGSLASKIRNLEGACLCQPGLLRCSPLSTRPSVFQVDLWGRSLSFGSLFGASGLGQKLHSRFGRSTRWDYPAQLARPLVRPRIGLVVGMAVRAQFGCAQLAIATAFVGTVGVVAATGAAH